MHFSREFTEHVGLITPRLKNLFEKMDSAGYTFTMAMFGEVAFSIMSKEKAVEAAALLEKVAHGNEAVVVGVDREGAKILD